MSVVRFHPGRMFATPNALATLDNTDIQQALLRHLSGDWGDVDKHDRTANDQALANGERLFSVYHSAKGVKFWVITEWNRSMTTIMLPEDY